MKPVEIVSNTLFYHVQDGRIVFRPWGSRGPCYLLSESQRVLRSRIQLAYYGVMLAVVIGIIDQFGTGMLLGFALPILIVGNHGMYWLFARGLPKTTAPDKPSAHYMREQGRANSRNFGKPLLWLLLIVSTAMSTGGFLGGILTGDYGAAILTGGFFGVCSIVFARRLKSA